MPTRRTALLRFGSFLGILITSAPRSAARQAQHHLHPRRRPRLRRPRLLRPEADQDAAPRPPGRRGHALHPVLRRRTVCAPSRCCPDDRPAHRPRPHPRQQAHVPLRPEDVTVAEVLKQAGYAHRASSASGAWASEGSTGVPTKQGFDYFFGYLNQTHAHNYYPDYLCDNEEKVPLTNDRARGRRTARSAKASPRQRSVRPRPVHRRGPRRSDRASQQGPALLPLPRLHAPARQQRGRASKGMEVPDRRRRTPTRTGREPRRATPP